MMAFLRLIPAWVWVALLLVGAGLWYGSTRYNAGEGSKQAEWDAAVERGQAELARLRAESGKITIQTETVYVDRVRTIREKGDEVIREIPVYIPADSPDLAGNWRLFHAAAVGEGPLPDPAGLTDAVPVGAQAFAATVAANYARFNENAARLTALQSWVRAQCRANPPPEGCGP